MRRNEAIGALAAGVRSSAPLKDLLIRMAGENRSDPAFWKKGFLEQLRRLPEADGFADRMAALFDDYLDIACGAERLSDRPDLILHNILELSRVEGGGRPPAPVPVQNSVREFEERLLEVVGPDRREEALEGAGRAA